MGETGAEAQDRSPFCRREIRSRPCVLSCRKESSVSLHPLATLAARRHARRAVAVAAVLGAGAFAVPASAGSTAAAATSSVRPAALVRAVVVVRPGVSLPMPVRGGHVIRAFPHLGSELVRAPVSSLRALASDPRVAGVSPDRAGRVAGYDQKPASGVLAPAAVGGDAGKTGVGYHVNVA